MTMHELDQLLQEHFPSAPRLEQGRAGVTVDRHRNERYETSPALRIDAAPSMYYVLRECPVCCKIFPRVTGTRKHWCSDACKQKAYRQRKKAGK